MRIREYLSSDLDALRRMHAAQNFGYPLPDLESPLLVSKLVLEEDVGEPGAPAVHRNSSASGSAELSAQRGPMNSEDARGDSASRAPRVTMAILQRLTVESYLLHDPAAGTPRQRWEHFLLLHDAALRDAAARGFDDVQAFLPPRVARSFGRRLERLGWVHDPWPCFSRPIR